MNFFRCSGGGGTNVKSCSLAVQRTSVGVNIIETNADSVDVKAVYSSGATSTYPLGCTIAGSNDKSTWTDIYSFPNSTTGNVTYTQNDIDISAYKYICAYSKTNGYNYMGTVVATVSFKSSTVPSGGTSIDPQLLYKATFNANSDGVSINVTEGKTYLACFGHGSSTDVSILNGGTKIYEEIDNGIQGGRGGYYSTNYMRNMIFTATSNTISIETTNKTYGIYDLMITQLD